MKLVFLFITLFAGVSTFAKKQNEILHLDLDASSAEYENILKQKQNANFTADQLQPVVNFGKRNLQWLDIINQARDQDKKLSFSSPESMTAHPVESPSEYNPDIILRDYNNLIGTLPQEMKDVLLNNQEMTPNLSTDVNVYLKAGLAIDKLYQTALRWRLVSPNLSYYASIRYRDIRGYYFLKQTPDLKNKLDSYKDLTVDDQAKFKEWLVGLCMNSRTSGTDCESEFEQDANDKNLWAYNNKYWSYGQGFYDAFFTIARSRGDVTWTRQNPDLMSIPFVNPHKDNIYHFLQDNIEDEWKWNNWHLRLNFVESSEWNTAHVKFEPGALPHVDGIAGSTITMDANSLLSEYDVRWTIRHEFGHVLGFPDCYFEFYNSERQSMMNYQLDITNLMCSRRGHLQQKHYDELKRVYFR